MRFPTWDDTLAAETAWCRAEPSIIMRDWFKKTSISFVVGRPKSTGENVGRIVGRG